MAKNYMEINNKNQYQVCLESLSNLISLRIYFFESFILRPQFYFLTFLPSVLHPMLPKERLDFSALAFCYILKLIYMLSIHFPMMITIISEVNSFAFQISLA